VHCLSHQLLNHLLANGAVLLASHFCDRLRDDVSKAPSGFGGET
jgi:hypothetical protein